MGRQQQTQQQTWGSSSRRNSTLPSLSATLYADSMAPCGLNPLRMLLWQLRPSPSYHRTCGSRRSLLTTQMLRRCYRNKLTTSSVTCTSCTLTTNREARDHSQKKKKKKKKKKCSALTPLL